jgi:hypothetical protein
MCRVVDMILDMNMCIKYKTICDDGASLAFAGVKMAKPIASFEHQARASAKFNFKYA